jgi:demethylmenaquinone methyltransferase/2-methoxy-6-polyprenyl-1,4-benzoquinol methylase
LNVGTRGYDVLPVKTGRLHPQRTYSLLSRFYDFAEGLFEIPAKRVALKLARPISGEAVLEIGPGTGWALRRLIRGVGKDGLACGVDIAPGMLAVAQKKLRGYPHVLIFGDAAALPLTSERFDLVSMTFVLDLIPTGEIAVVLGEVMRVLKPGGRLVDASLSREELNLGTRLYESLHKLLPVVFDCRPIYLRRSLEDAGFEIAKTRRMTTLGLQIEVVVGRKPAPPLV